jgi:hypothetical protein
VPFDLDGSYADRSSIVKELFVESADDNYIAARWCFMQGLNVDFLWLGVHCLEKYLKAALLLNGRSAKSYGHDITRLYSDVSLLAPELLPDDLPKPDQFDVDHWPEEPTQRFIERLYRDGQPDNRYQLFGYVRHCDDLFKLDEVVFRVRRLCQPLEAHFLGKKHRGVPDQSRRERMVRDHPMSMRLNCKLEDTISGNRGAALQHALLNWNFAFAPCGYADSEFRYSSTARNPVLVRRLYDPLRAGPQAASNCDDLWRWVQDNIQLPKALVREIEQARQNIKKELAPLVTVP